MSWVILFVLNKIYQTPILLSVYKTIKYIFRLTVRTTELYRLCHLPPRLVSHTMLARIDQSIFYSTRLNNEKLILSHEECNIEELSKSISTKKSFPENDVDSIRVLSLGLTRIHQLNLVLLELETHISTHYDVNNPSHEEKLLKLWKLLKPTIELEGRLSKQWVDIGFQGEDPATDFRGMGIEGLNELLYLAEHYPEEAGHILTCASDPVYWYPYAIVGINLTKYAYSLLESRKLRFYLFQYGTSLDTFYEFYCTLFYQFNQFWTNHEPKLTVMDFESSLVEFKKRVEGQITHQTIVPFSDYSRIQPELEEKKDK